MADTSADPDDRLVIGNPGLEIPLLNPPSAEEIERRKKVIARTRALRERIGPISIATDDLVHESREDLEH